MLSLESLKKAIKSFETAIRVIDRKQQKTIMDLEEAEEIEVLKAGVIQNFEFTYEQSWKLMKRWIEENIGAEIVDGVSRRELYRVAIENKLIIDLEQWMEFHRARNSSSHIYDGTVADEVYNTAKLFLPVAKDLLMRLEQRND